MHIAFLTPEFPHPKVRASAGIGTSILNLATGLVAAGHKVSVVVYGQREDEFLQSGEIGLYLVKNIKFKGLSRWLTQKKLTSLLDRLVARDGLQIVEAPDWTGFSSGIRPKCPLVVKMHGSDTYFCHLEGRAVKTLNRRRERKALLNADALASVSRFTAGLTQSLFGFHREVSILPNGIDAERFEPSPTTSGEPVVLYFGTLIRKKGLLELPLIFNKVVAEIPNARLVLVGKDSADAVSGKASTWELMLPLFSEEAKAAAKWTGAVAYNEMAQYINSAHVCVFPTFAEALPVSWIEAMAMGKAIVASDIGWAGELIENETDGFLVHPLNHGEFAARIVEVLRDGTLRERLGKNAREKALSRFSMQHVAARNVDFYNTVLQSRR